MPAYDEHKKYFGNKNELFLNLSFQQNTASLGYFKGGHDHTSRKLYIYFFTSHNFFSLSSVQIIIIPACCLLCVL